ncbi:MAG: hypothetical protein AB4042_14245 [Leptolyngbyaceae cyanobacterium]
MKRSPFFLNLLPSRAGGAVYPFRPHVALVALAIGTIIMTGTACSTASSPGSTNRHAESAPTGLQQGVEDIPTSQGTDGGTDTPERPLAQAVETPTSSPPDSVEPSEEVVAQILEAIATDLDQPTSALSLEDLAPETWPDGCLGLRQEGELCTMALIDGWHVQVATDETMATYRTNLEGTLVRREL